MSAGFHEFGDAPAVTRALDDEVGDERDRFGMVELDAALEGAPCESGVSALDGFLVARLLSPSPESLRLAILSLFSHLLGRAAPRVWQ